MERIENLDQEDIHVQPDQIKSFIIQQRLTYKEALYKKLRHSISEKAIDKTKGYCSTTIG